MVDATIDAMVTTAEKKRDFGIRHPARYFLLAMMAGVYVGFGIILIFSIGAPLKGIDAAVLKTIMGASFGVALTLVIFAGSELFTGNNLVLTVGSLSGKVSWSHTLRLWLICLAGNYVGSLLLAWIFVASGLGTNEATAQFVRSTAAAKMSAPFFQLFLRGILCNILVCLAVWTSARATSDSGKILLIFWCLFAFIGSGYEHSIANMTLLGIAAFLPGTNFWRVLVDMQANLIPVTLGNFIGGAVFVGAAYWSVAHGFATKKVTANEKSTVSA